MERNWNRFGPKRKTSETDKLAAEIRQKYLVEQKTLRATAAELDMTVDALNWFVRAYEIPKRSNPRNAKPEEVARIAARIEEDHWENGKTLRQICREIGIGWPKMQWYLKRYNISRRRRIESIVHATGGHGYNWKGGKFLYRHRKTNGDPGKPYVMLLKPDHPNANKSGRIYEHRYVMAEHIGRPIKVDEVVHHVNGDTLDNRIENLEVRHRGTPEDYHHGYLTVCPRCGYDLYR